MKFYKWALGLAMIGVVSLAPVAQASLTVVNNLSDSPLKGEAQGAESYKAAGFYTEVGGAINNIILTLAVNILNAPSEDTTLDVYIYTANSSGVPTGSKTLVGTVNANTLGVHQFTVALSAVYELTAGDYYAIVVNLAPSGKSGGNYNVGWEYVANGSSSGAGARGNFVNKASLNSTDGVTYDTQEGGQQRMMEVDVVPEPITQALMIFGPVALLVFVRRRSLLRFKQAA